jgi:hypothetical protein
MTAASIALLAVLAQTRDAAPPATGTAMVTGTVMTDEAQPRPLRRAVVTINSSDPVVGRTAITDDAGRFAFVNLPAARYTLFATKRGWVGMSLGAKAPGRPGQTVALAAGQRAAAAFRLPRPAVITGTVLDQNGVPPANISMRLMRYSYIGGAGERRLIPIAASFTGPDERGHYRIYGISPGDYFVSVTTTGRTFNGGFDMHLTTDVDVEAAIKAVEDGANAPMIDVPQRSVGLSTIFYPGAASVAQATPITLRAGEERSGIDFTVQYAGMARVEGTVAGPDGMPVTARVSLVVNDPNAGAIGIDSIRNAQAGADGHFAFAEVAPGSYVMSAHTSLPPAGPGAPPQILGAVTELDVQSDVVSGLSLTLQEGLMVSGLIRSDGTTPPPDFASVRVTLVPLQNVGVTVSTGGATTQPDGRFALTGVTPGRYRLSVSVPSPQSPWTIRSATVGGQDALDGGVDIRQSFTDAAVTLTDRISELTGKIEAAASDVTVVLFAANSAYWTGQSRRILSSRAGKDGSFTFKRVPPGDYLMSAVDDAEPGEWYDPSFLQRLAPAAIKVAIAEGEKKVQDIRIGGGG